MSFRVLPGGGETTTNLRVLQNNGPAQIGMVDYVWVKGIVKSGIKGSIKNKTRVVLVSEGLRGDLIPNIPRWHTHSEDGEILILSPCHYLPDPLRPQPSFISLCEVRDRNDQCIAQNYRAKLRELEVARESILWGFRQEYQLVTESSDSPNSPTRDVVMAAERHLGACMDAGLLIHSARVGFDFKIGERGMPASIDPDPATALVAADHLWIARYLLLKIAREYGLRPVYQNRCSVFFSIQDRSAQQPLLFKLRLALSQHAQDGLLNWTPELHATVISPNGDLQCFEDRGPPGDADPYRVIASLWGALRETSNTSKEWK